MSIHRSPQLAFMTLPTVPELEWLRRHIAVEGAAYDLPRAQVLDEAAADTVVRDPGGLRHAVKMSIVSGTFANTFRLARAHLLRSRPTIDDDLIAAKLLHLSSEVLGDRFTTPNERLAVRAFHRRLLDEGVEFLVASHKQAQRFPETKSARYSAFLERIRRTFGDRADPVFTAIPERAYDAKAEIYDRIVELATDRLPQLSLRGRRELGTAPEQVLKVLEVWGPEGWGFFPAHEPDMLQTIRRHEHTYRKILARLAIDHCDDEFGVTVRAITPDLIERYPRHIELIVEKAGSYQHAAFAGIGEGLLEYFSPETLAGVLGSARYHAEAVKMSLRRIVEQYPDDRARLDRLLAGLVSGAGTAIHELLANADPALFGATREHDFLKFVQQRGKLSGGLCKAFGIDVVAADRRSSRAVDQVKQFFDHGAADLLGALPTERWNAAEFERLHARFGKAAGQVIAEDREWLDLEAHPRRDELCRENRRHFNLRAFHRYTSPTPAGIDCSLLTNNLENLSPAMRAGMPVALAVFGTDDHNNALRNAYRELVRISYGYKLLIVEVESSRQFIEAIMRFGDPEFAPSGIEFLLFHVHGYRDFASFREFKRFRTVDKSIDGPLLLPEHLKGVSLRRYCSPRLISVIGSCEAAFHDDYALGTLGVIKDSLGGEAAFGSRRNSYLRRVEFDSGERAVGASFGCSTRNVVRL